MNQAGTDPRESHPKPPFPEQTQSPTGSERALRPEPDYGETSYQGHGRLRGRVALITGADSGIGRAVALAYAREGADVGIGYLESQEDAEQTRRVVEEAGRKAVLLQGDIADPEVCRRMVEEIVTELGRLDILVNNAAYQGEELDSIEALDAERVERTFRVNIMSMFHLVRAALPHLAPGSAVINVSSIQAYQPSPSILDYAATKGAIITFTKGLAHELIERGIRVNAVAPGPVWTPLVAASFEPERVSKHGTSAPIGRPAQPVELAPAFVYLASDDSSFVIGEVLGVTGGMLMP